MKFLTLSIRRPVAVAMFFFGLMLVGAIAWQRMSVELLPSLQGNRIFVDIRRPGSDPEVIEREILLPLHARVSAMPHVSESWGEARGSFGQYQVRFESGADLKVRELELQRVAVALEREQPRGTKINVIASDSSAFSSLVMMVHVLGVEDDKNVLHDLVSELVAPRFASVPGVSQVRIGGGARRQVTVTVDPDRATALGVTTEAITRAVDRNVGQLRYVGKLENEGGRVSVVLDGRPHGLRELGDARIDYAGPARLRHVSELDFGVGREEVMFRVNGQSAVGLIVYQEEGANLVRLGRILRERVKQVRAELAPLGVDLVIGTDAAELVEDQISHLGRLGLSGFIIALVVLYLFLRQWRAVAVVGVAVPVSLLTALALLYLMGLSLNLVSLFGLALAIGVVVDNSVVVYEAVLRRLERGANAEFAVHEGLRRTIRAIIAASATSAVVFLPLTLVEFDDALMREVAKVVTLSILLPLAASLVVAVGLVPLLAHRLAAPAALRKLARSRLRRARRGNLVPPDRARLFFTGVVAAALRHPPAWIAGTVAAVFLTFVISLSWIGSNSANQEPAEADTVQLTVRFANGRVSMDVASDALGRLERAALDLAGVERVEAMIQEDGASLNVHLVDRDDRAPGFRAQTVRQAVRAAATKAGGLQILRPGEEQRDGGRGGAKEVLGGTPAEIVLSGPDSSLLQTLAGSVRAQLESMPQVTQAWVSARPGMEEIWVEPNQRAFEALGLTFDQVLPILRIAGRDGERLQNDFVLPSGRELPLAVERRDARRHRGASRDLRRLRVHTDVGAVPLMSLASIRRMPPPPVIAHHNGRREISVFYRLDDEVPSTGPGRLAIEEQIAEAVRSVPRPTGYALETVEDDQTASLASQVIVPVVLLLFLVLAMTFESLILPALVLIALPLTLLGATWALVFAGMGLDMMALLGALALIGLTVNPAILLVDRMQQRVLAGGWSAGAAALASVRERTRPVLMTTATTVAGLWPLALATGRENEIWPPFATVVIGGLVTSTLLTLLLIPVGFILLRRLDVLFGRVGPWLVIGWLGSTVSVMVGLIATATVTSLFWQVALSFLIGGALLAVTVLIFRRADLPEPDCSHGPPVLDVRNLRKVYGLPGPLRATLRTSKAFARRVLERGGQAFDVADARERLAPLTLGALGMGYLASQLHSSFWRLVFIGLAAGLLSRLMLEIRRARGKTDAMGTVRPGGLEGWLAACIPWIAIGGFAWVSVVTRLADETPFSHLALPGFAALLLLALQGVRRSARRQARGDLDARVAYGFLRGLRSLWRGWAARVGGLDLPVHPVVALDGVNFVIERGMVGVLGPNGAGKTTLLRQLAGVLDPTRGTIGLGGVPLGSIQRFLARWVGYLPQDAGLPSGMTAREYLTYFAALYALPQAMRKERVAALLDEVGLGEKADVPINSLSGGMRQRVAVARTLLRLPPVIIVDEPTVGLDPRERIRFRDLLSRLARERIVLFSTHVVEDVAVACERVLVLARGALLFDGAPGALASVASGCTWQLRTAPDEPIDLPPDAIRAEETPAPDGSIVLRILAAERPADEATPLSASLEDGYMWLLASTAEDRPV